MSESTVFRHVIFKRNMRLPHISLIAAFFAYFSKVRISHNFPHKMAFSTAILILFVFLLAISIRFRYLDHLVANRMALSMCPDLRGMRQGSWFQAVLYHTATYFCRIFGVHAVRIFSKSRIKLTCLSSQCVSR